MDTTTKYVLYGLGGVAVVGGVTYYLYATDKMHNEPTSKGPDGKSVIQFKMWLAYKIGDKNWKNYYVIPKGY